MLLPDGYSDVARGKIAAVVTHLEMTERPAIPGSARAVNGLSASDEGRVRELSGFVIPGCAAWRRPGIHTPGVSLKCQDKDLPTPDFLLQSNEFSSRAAIS